MLWLITLSVLLAAVSWRLLTRPRQTVRFERSDMLGQLDYLYTNGNFAQDEYASRRALWLEPGSGER